MSNARRPNAGYIPHGSDKGAWPKASNKPATMANAPRRASPSPRQLLRKRAASPGLFRRLLQRSSTIQTHAQAFDFCGHPHRPLRIRALMDGARFHRATARGRQAGTPVRPVLSTSSSSSSGNKSTPATLSNSSSARRGAMARENAGAPLRPSPDLPQCRARRLISPTICSTRSSIVTRPSTPPYSSITSAICTRSACIFCSRTEMRMEGGA